MYDIPEDTHMIVYLADGKLVCRMLEETEHHIKVVSDSIDKGRISVIYKKNIRGISH